MLTLDRYTSPDYDREITREDEAILRLNDVILYKNTYRN